VLDPQTYVPPVPLLLLSLAGIGLVLNDLPALADLDGFSRLTAVPGDLQLYLLGSLPDLRGLAALQQVGLNAVIGANGLTSLKGLGEWASLVRWTGSACGRLPVLASNSIYCKARLCYMFKPSWQHCDGQTKLWFDRLSHLGQVHCTSLQLWV
jgi:hypothetical protein